MALDGTYSGLKASIADWLNRGDLAAAIPDYIVLAEAQMSRSLVQAGPVRPMMGRSDATINAEFVALPSDFMGARAIYLTGSSKPLDFVEPEKIVERKALYPSADGDPQVFSVVGGELQFWPWVGNSYSGEMTYWKRLAPLSDNQSNWLYSIHPDAYLYGALLQAAPYLRDDGRVTMWTQAFGQILSDIVAADKVERFAPHMAMPINNFTP